MARSDMVDFAPGENHIALRCDNKCYYVPEVFQYSPTYDKVVPLLISDVNKGKTVRMLYGIFDSNYQDILIINNYPVKRFKIFGKIIGEIYKDFDNYGRANPKNFILITVDDFSGTSDSTIKVKVFESMYMQSGLQFSDSYGKIVEISGTINEYHYIREVHADFISLIGGEDDLDVEISMWQEILRFRAEVLAKPWVFNSPVVKLKESNIDYNLYVEEDEEINVKNKVTLYSNSSYDKNVTEDSLLVLKNAIDKHHFNDSLGSSSEVDNNSDSSVQMTAVKQVPIQVMTNFQLSLGFICWILRNKFRCFKLIELYNDSSINWLLSNMANLSYLNQHLQEEKKSHKLLKQEIFHSIRHNLQVNYNLIKVTKSQKVYSTNLKTIYDHIKSCLNVIKFEKKSNNNIRILHIKSYLNNLRTYTPECSNINHKILNGIIDFILTNDWNERSHWSYDAKSIQWMYTKN